MALQILLIIAIILQLVAAVMAIRLMRVTKYNFSWILFTTALIAMAIQLLVQYIEVRGMIDLKIPPDFFAWIGVTTSLCFAVGMVFVYQIFNYIGKTETQRRLTEKRLLSTVLRTEEKERMHFSKELHDGMGPLLSSAKMQLSSLKREAMTPENLETVNNVEYVIEEAIRSLKEISNNLSPHVLKDFGLARAISNFISKAPVGSCKVEFVTNLKKERFDIDIETIVYRVICELLNNSIKHSGASRIDLAITYSADLMVIHYADNGTGFNTGAVMDVGMGLSNIHSRISSIKGTCDISSDKNRGMEANISIDLCRKIGKKHA